MVRFGGVHENRGDDDDRDDDVFGDGAILEFGCITRQSGMFDTQVRGVRALVHDPIGSGSN